MNDFEFYNPVKVLFGAGKVDAIGTEAKRYGQKALVVSYREHGFMSELLNRVSVCLYNAGMTPVPFYEVVANPMMSDAEKGIALAKESAVDLVIAVGGGSVMDSAKTIAAGVLYNGNPWNMFNSRHDGGAHCEAPVDALPLLMVPTLPATSSEMNCGAVITNDETLEKSYVFAECLYSKVSILDPELLTTLPAYQTACGTADALSHILEIYLNCTVHNPVQFRMMEGIGRTLIEMGPQVLKDPENVELRGIQQWACSLAWNGWTMPGMDGFFPMHAVGHAISARHGTAHGHTLAIMMPAFMRYIAKDAPERIIEFGKAFMGLCPESGDVQAQVAAVIDAFEQYLNELGLTTRISDLKLTKEDLPAIQENAMRIFADQNGIIHAVRPVPDDGVKELLEAAF